MDRRHGGPRRRPVDVYVPPGESRVVRVPRPEGTATRPRRSFSRATPRPFDNTLYVVDEHQAGGDGPLRRRRPARRPRRPALLPDARLRSTRRGGRVKVVAAAAAGADRCLGVRHRTAAWSILAAETSPENARGSSDVRRGRRRRCSTCAAEAGPGRDPRRARWTHRPGPIEEAPASRDVLLSEIAFDHPLFAPFAGPQFSDFTKIHFWKHRKARPRDAIGERAGCLARFENGDPAVLEKAVGKGSLIVMASGWKPADSQLARSSKFVPLMMACSTVATRIRSTPRTHRRRPDRAARLDAAGRRP